MNTQTISRNIFLFAAFYSSFFANAQNLNPAQIKQIEDIAKKIAAQSNGNKQAMLDEMTVSFNAVAVGRNVRFENVIRVKKRFAAQHDQRVVRLNTGRNHSKIVRPECKEPSL